MGVSVDVLEIGEFADFAERHSGDWQRIAASSDRATVFQTWEWVSAWWQHHRSGKRFRGLVFRENGVVIGLAALFQSSVPTLFRTLRFVGTGGSDYLDLIALPGKESSVCGAFETALAERRTAWDWIDLHQVRAGAVLDTFGTDGLSRAVQATPWRGETCPYLALAPDWAAFRAGLGKKLRQNVGYYGRALEKAYIVEIRTATEETLADDLDAFFFLHQRRWNQRWMPGAFASQRERAFHTNVASRLLSAGMLRLHTLTLDGTVQAALYCFQKADRCYYYLGGFEPKFARQSIGTVLTSYAIRYAIEQDGAKEFDFLRGDEGYKYKWGARDRYNRRLSITHPGLRPALLAAGGRLSLTMEQKLKSYMHRRHGGPPAGADNHASVPDG
jgi:CelD/BcsL family acetyltransferase involved in cellulose biosynthesis